MIRFWEKETREARIFRVEGFGLFTLGCLPAQACETGSAAAQGPPQTPDSAASGIGDGAGAAPRHRSAFLARWGQIM